MYLTSAAPSLIASPPSPHHIGPFYSMVVYDASSMANDLKHVASAESISQMSCSSLCTYGVMRHFSLDKSKMEGKWTAGEAAVRYTTSTIHKSKTLQR